MSLAQAGVLEVHVRGSTIEHLEAANRLVFDLDPGPGVEWRDVIAGAREVKQRLEALKLKSFVKTTGGKGLHVVLPIRPAPWDDVKEFCRGVAEGMAADNRARYTATIKKSARDRKIFVDYLRNSREATAIAPYSTRARPGATVAVPLSWEELGNPEGTELVHRAESVETAFQATQGSLGRDGPRQAIAAGQAQMTQVSHAAAPAETNPATGSRIQDASVAGVPPEIAGRGTA